MLMVAQSLLKPPASPRPRVSSARSHSPQNTGRKPNEPSSTLVGPVKPSYARLAASTPLSEARPRCNRLTIPPFPARANSSSPEASEPAMPSALVIRAGSSPKRCPAAIAAPNGRCARRVKAARFVGVPGGAPDPHHDLAAGDERRDQRPAARTPFLRDGEGRREKGGAGMHARTRPGQAVEFESVGERAVGEGCRGRLDRGTVAAEDVTLAAGPGAPGVACHDPAPRQGAAADHRRHRIDDAFFRPPPDLLGEISISKGCGIFGEPDGFLRHVVGPPG